MGIWMNCSLWSCGFASVGNGVDSKGDDESRKEN
jgi:hypothetical protein